MHYFPTEVHSPLHEEEKKKEKEDKKQTNNQKVIFFFFYPNTVTCEMRDGPKISPTERYTLSLSSLNTYMHTHIHFPMGHNIETYPQTPSVH